MFPAQDLIKHWEPCFLRIRGGVSSLPFVSPTLIVFSPHTWRCFWDLYFRQSAKQVFSAYAEVFLKDYTAEPSTYGFLHIRGGVSDWLTRAGGQDQFSPLTRRCFCHTDRPWFIPFVFSAYAEVFPSHGFGTFPRLKFSLHTRRCFFVTVAVQTCCLVFSAFADVFLKRAAAGGKLFGFLRACGGVSV